MARALHSALATVPSATSVPVPSRLDSARIARWSGELGLRLGLAWLLCSTAVHAKLDDESAACQECHAVADLTMKDPQTGGRRPIAIRTEEYTDAAHGRVSCTGCHEHGYTGFPHSGPRIYPRMLCVTCHELDSKVARFHLEERRSELEQSVHGDDVSVDGEEAQPFDCHTCHDPHLFVPVSDMGDAIERIHGSNQLCLGCHGGGARAPFDELRDIRKLHDFLPNRTDHFRKIKCVACHVDLTSLERHRVLPKKDAVRRCEECHSENSARLGSVYGPNSRALDAEPEGGAVGAEEDTLRDHAYVIGSTRSARLDILMLVGWVGVLLLLGAHALARFLHSRGEGRAPRSRGDEAGR